MTETKRGKNVAIVGTILQLVFTAAMLTMWLLTKSLAAMVCTWALASGVLLWLMAAVLFYCRQLAAQEEIELAEMAARCFNGAADSEAPALVAAEIDVICPVPLHPARQRLRGFNQSELIARRLGQSLGLAVNMSALRRTKPTQPQIELTGDQRRRNVRGAFAVEDKAAVAGKGVLVLDDVWTTGSTITECARVLRRAGAARVLVLTVARAVRY